MQRVVPHASQSSSLVDGGRPVQKWENELGWELGRVGEGGVVGEKARVVVVGIFLKNAHVRSFGHGHRRVRGGAEPRTRDRGTTRRPYTEDRSSKSHLALLCDVRRRVRSCWRRREMRPQSVRGKKTKSGVGRKFLAKWETSVIAHVEHETLSIRLLAR